MCKYHLSFEFWTRAVQYHDIGCEVFGMSRSWGIGYRSDHQCQCIFPNEKQYPSDAIEPLCPSKDAFPQIPDCFPKPNVVVVPLPVVVRPKFVSCLFSVTVRRLCPDRSCRILSEVLGVSYQLVCSSVESCRFV